MSEHLPLARRCRRRASFGARGRACAEQWERDGCVPREVLRKMGGAGLLGLMVDWRGMAAPRPMR